MESAVRLYSLSLKEIKTYLWATLFIAGNLILPQLCHYVGGGLVWQPIYFFTLIATYKYGIRVGLLTAILSPALNHLLFGMPPAVMLPEILMKSVLLASLGAYTAHRLEKISFWAIAGVVLAYQLIGILISWGFTANTAQALQGFRVAIPGILLQILGGYAILKAIAKL